MEFCDSDSLKVVYALQQHHQEDVINTITGGLILIVVFLAIYLYRRIRLTRQLKRAYVQLEQAYDKLEEVTTQKERIESELRIAHDIQMKMLPDIISGHPDIDIYASMTPAKEMCGDLYDFFVRDNLFYFCIGDVAGKGVPAALFMTVTKSLFRTYAIDENTPDYIVTQMNHNLGEDNKNRMFVTLFVGILDLTSGLLRYCNAGHEAPIIIHKDASLLPVNRIFPVGAMDDTSYQLQTAVIEPQTTILLYTDGLNEAMNIKKEMFGKDRILSVVNGAIHDGQLSPKALIDRMTQAVHNYVGDVEQSDDLTMLAINYLKQ